MEADRGFVESLDIYGRNVVTSEGSTWRLHRKITSKPFSERNNQLVHDESVRQALQMMQSWTSQSHNGRITIEKSHPHEHPTYFPLNSY